MITESEVQQILAVLKNPRDRGFVSAPYDSGCKIGELITLKNRDISFDQYGTILSVTEKTGYRRVRIVGNSISYLREWQNYHPDRNNGEAWFFCGIEAENRGKKLEHANVYKFLRKALKQAKIERRIYSPSIQAHKGNDTGLKGYRGSSGSPDGMGAWVKDDIDIRAPVGKGSGQVNPQGIRNSCGKAIGMPEMWRTQRQECRVLLKMCHDA